MYFQAIKKIMLNSRSIVCLLELKNVAFLTWAEAPWKWKSERAEVPDNTVSQAEWCENPIELPARQVYSPASSKVTLRKYRISSSLSVVLTPAVYRGGKTYTKTKEEREKTDKPNSRESNRQTFEKILKRWYFWRVSGSSSFPTTTSCIKCKRFPSPGSYSVPLMMHASKSIKVKNCFYSMTVFGLVKRKVKKTKN